MNWIKCSEQLPPHHTWNIITNGFKIDIAYYSEDYGFIPEKDREIINQSNIMFQYKAIITHWIPLPSLPTEDEK